MNSAASQLSKASRVLAMLILTALFALTIGAKSAYADLSDLFPQPWKAYARVGFYGDTMYKADGLSFSVVAYDAGDGRDLRLGVTVYDSAGHSASWPSSNLRDVTEPQAFKGSYRAEYYLDPSSIAGWQTGTCTIVADLDYFNGNTGMWTDVVEGNVSRTFNLADGSYVPPEPEPLPEFPLPGCFADMQDPNDWRYDGVYAVAAAGMITGYGNELFGVDDPLTTAQLITILWRYAEPEASSSTDTSSVLNNTYLVDVEDRQYYTAAVNWAFENGVVHGMETPCGYVLGPDQEVTTERAMTILANYLTKDEPAMTDQKVDGYLLKCVDGAAVSEWARPSIAWALKTRMITGYETADGREIRPYENIARGRFAVILNNGINTGVLPMD